MQSGALYKPEYEKLPKIGSGRDTDKSKCLVPIIEGTKSNSIRKCFVFFGKVFIHFFFLTALIEQRSMRTKMLKSSTTAFLMT